MIRLLKLAIYAVLGYVIYEFYQGISAPQQSSAGSGGGGMRHDLKKALNQGTGRMRMSGQGQGARAEVTDEGGASRTTRAGRGVTSSR